MAVITKVGTPSLSSLLLSPENKISGLLAGEAIGPGDPCYVKNDGKVWKSLGAGVNAAAKVRGYALAAAQVGEAVTLMRQGEQRYGSGLTPGADVFLAVAGGFDTAATTGGTAPIGYAIDTTRIMCWESRY